MNLEPLNLIQLYIFVLIPIEILFNPTVTTETAAKAKGSDKQYGNYCLHTVNHLRRRAIMYEAP